MSSKNHRRLLERNRHGLLYRSSAQGGRDYRETEPPPGVGSVEAIRSLSCAAVNVQSEAELLLKSDSPLSAG